MVVKRLAIIGLGSIGRRHLRILKEIRPDIEVTLVRSGKGSSWGEEKFAYRTVNSIADAIQEGVQAAIISTPASIHLEQAIELVRADIHILVEKPLSNSLNGIEQLISEFQNRNIVGTVGYVLRHHPGAEYFKNLLEKGIVGKQLHARIECGSFLPDWRPGQDYRTSVSALPKLGGGVLLELSHELDYIRWFFGEIKFVIANLWNSNSLEISVEDCADLILKNMKDMPISLHLDFNSRHPTRRSKVCGTKGDLVWDATNNNVIWHPVTGNPQVEKFDFDRDIIYRKQLSHFLGCIEDGTPSIVTIDGGVRTLELVDAARRSHEAGQCVVLA